MEEMTSTSALRAPTREVPYPRWVEIVVVFGFFSVYFLTRLLHSGIVLSGMIFWGSYYLTYAALTFVLFRACRELHVSNVGWIGAIIGHGSLMFVVTVGAEVVIESGQLYLHRWFSLPPLEPDPHTPLAVVRHLTFTEQFGNYTFILLAGLTRDFFLRYVNKQAQAHELKERTQSLQTQLTSARLEALRMQINPHFLFNTLHVINTMAGRNPDGVRQTTNRLSDLLRYVLSTSDVQEVPLSQELQFLRGYVDIQKLRLQGQLQVEIDVTSEVQDALVPTLLLQPLVENAVKHGVQRVKGVGRMRVCVHRRGQALVLRVEDNGPGVRGQPDEGIGLENTRKRLTELYVDTYTFDLATSELGGCCVEVRIPYHTDQDPHVEAISTDGVNPLPAA